MVMENLEQREIGRSGVYPHRYVHLRNPALRAWVRMLRLSQKVQPALAERLRGLGLNPAEFGILDTLGAREGLTQQELADALLVTKGNMTYHLCRMAERGLVDRLADVAYLDRFPFSGLPRVARYCARGGVKVVSTHLVSPLINW